MCCFLPRNVMRMLAWMLNDCPKWSVGNAVQATIIKQWLLAIVQLYTCILELSPRSSSTLCVTVSTVEAKLIVRVLDGWFLVVQHSYHTQCVVLVQVVYVAGVWYFNVYDLHVSCQIHVKAASELNPLIQHEGNTETEGHQFKCQNKQGIFLCGKWICTLLPKQLLKQHFFFRNTWSVLMNFIWICSRVTWSEGSAPAEGAKSQIIPCKLGLTTVSLLNTNQVRQAQSQRVFTALHPHIITSHKYS